MSVITTARDLRNAITPADVAAARPRIDSQMMFKCLEQSIDNKVCRQIMAKLTDIARDGPTLFKQITVDTFTTSQAQTFNVKTKLYSLDIKAYKHNITKFHQDIGDKIDTLNAVGKPPSNKDIIIGLFKAYDSAKSLLFKEHVCYLKSEYNEGRFTQSKQLMVKIEAKYNELCTEKKWKANKKEDNPSVIALTAFLAAFNNKKEDKPKADKKQTAAWKYDK